MASRQGMATRTQSRGPLSGIASSDQGPPSGLTAADPQNRVRGHIVGSDVKRARRGDGGLEREGRFRVDIHVDQHHRCVSGPVETGCIVSARTGPGRPCAGTNIALSPPECGQARGMVAEWITAGVRRALRKLPTSTASEAGGLASGGTRSPPPAGSGRLHQALARDRGPSGCLRPHQMARTEPQPGSWLGSEAPPPPAVVEPDPYEVMRAQTHHQGALPQLPDRRNDAV